MTFIAQNAPDIQKKLQKVEGAFGMPMSQLVEFAFKVFNSRDQASEERKQRKMRQQAGLQAAVLPSGGPKRTTSRLRPLGNKGSASDTPKVGSGQHSIGKETVQT